MAAAYCYEIPLRSSVYEISMVNTRLNAALQPGVAFPAACVELM